ncbi:MAG: LysR family transcriptional regulator [Kiloniellales bacterium]
MDTRQLQTLLAIAEEGNFAAAARKVNLTPSAVSQQIAALEKEIGVAVFDRSRRPPALNAKGVQLLQAARTILQIVEDTRADITGKGVTGTLNIGALRTCTFGLLPRAIADLRETYPQLTYSLTVGFSQALMNDVVSGRLDVAIVAEHVGVLPSLRWTPFLHEPLLVVAPPGTPRQTTGDWLTDWPYIRYKTSVPLANQIDTELARLGVAPRDVVVVDTMPAAIGFVKAGLGVSVVPLMSLQDQMAATNLPVIALPAVPFGDPPSVRRIGTVQRMSSARSSVIATFHEALLRQAEVLQAPHGQVSMPAARSGASGPGP